MLPRTAQDIIFEIVQGIGSEQARSAALRNLSSDLPFELRNRLAALGETIADPLNRLQIAMQYETEPDSERIRFFLNTARGIDEEGARGQALATLRRTMCCDSARSWLVSRLRNVSRTSSVDPNYFFCYVPSDRGLNRRCGVS